MQPHRDACPPHPIARNLTTNTHALSFISLSSPWWLKRRPLITPAFNITVVSFPHIAVNVLPRP